MPTQVIMPQLGESVVEGTVSKWLKAKGDAVEEYEPLLEVNTDKVDSEIPSPVSGILLDILVEEGTTVHAGTVLALIGGQGERAGDGPTSREAELKGNGGGATETVAATKTVAATETAAQAQGAPATTSTQDTSVPAHGRDRDLGFISPVVAKIAHEQGIDLSQVPGTGLGGRITKKDVLAYVESIQEAGTQVAGTQVQEPAPAYSPAPERPSLSPLPSTPAPSPHPGEVLPLTAVRRAIAEHMVYSKRTSPHVTTVMEADLSRVTAHRSANKEAFARDGANLTFTVYFISAIVSALKVYPMVNSSWKEEGVLLHREINIGMAVSLGEAGLIVPVIKHADGLSLLGLARAVNDLADRARARQLKPDEVNGGTFTLTNHGTSGSLFATPIINQPQCAILGVGAIQKRVVVVPGAAGEDAIAIRPMAYVSLTFDHRILDGAVADYFLGKVVELLQNWN